METKITLPTSHGKMEFQAIERMKQSGVLAMRLPMEKPPFVRIHSSCLFSESFHSSDCDCARQLDAALDYIGTNGGLLIYLYQEGRGVGLLDKMRAIHLEQKYGIDTVEAFSRLGHADDPRSYEAAISVLNELGIREVVLNSENVLKKNELQRGGIKVKKCLNLPIATNPDIDKYLEKKRTVLGYGQQY